MDIMELGAIGELVGGVAVVASLVYVGLQVRQSNQLNRTESIRSFARDYNAFLAQFREPEFLELFQRAAVDFNSLSGREKSQTHFMLLNHLMLGWADSTIDPKKSNEFARFLDTGFASVVRAPGFAQWWDHFKGAFRQWGPSYVDTIEQAEVRGLEHSMPWLLADATEQEEV